MIEPNDPETLVMVHRYLYYVLGEPVLSDHEYDHIERQARAVCPPDSPVHKVGSSLPSSYHIHIKLQGQRLLAQLENDNET